MDFKEPTLFEVEKAPPSTLADRFGVVPFSVLDRRQGDWQSRRKKWLSLGIRSEVGRDSELTFNTGDITNLVATSVFDPVVCEAAYRWFSPPGGKILDPFAGGSVRGIIASLLERHYTGIDLSQNQIDSNYEQIGIANADFLPNWVVGDSRELAGTRNWPSHINHFNDKRPIAKTSVLDPFFQEALDLHNATSSLPMRDNWGTIPETLAEYLDCIYDVCGSTYSRTVESGLSFADAVDNGTMWVAFSGGKDCIAAALKAKEEGWDVVLYHVHGINRSWPDELEWAQLAADYLNMPLVVDSISISGTKNGFIEFPTKNQVITMMMMSAMFRYGGSHYTLGTMANDTPDACKFDLNWSDSTVAINLFAKHVEARFPGAVLHTYLKSETESLAIVAKNGLLEIAHGCMAPIRFRETTRTKNEEKFGPLLPGRCGSCTKCVKEYATLFALKAIPENKALEEHALKKCKEVLVSEFETPPGIEHIIDPEIVLEYAETAYPAKPLLPPQRISLDVGGGSEYDMVFTCPPYADLEVYSDDPRDLSNMDYAEFLKVYKEIFGAAVGLLKQDSFIVIVVGDVRDKNGNYYGLVADTINVMRELGCPLYNELIIIDPVGTLAQRVSKQMEVSRKIGKTHQQMLVFVKGDARKATERMGEI